MFEQKEFELEQKGSGKTKISQFMNYGNQKAKINRIELKEAKTGTKKVIFHMETEPITTEGFEPHAESMSKGQIGKVDATIYLKTQEQMEEFHKNTQIIADKLGTLEQVKALSADSLEDYIAKVSPYLTGKYAYWQICAEVYDKSEKGYDKYSLKLGRFGFVASLEEGIDHLKPFDKSKAYNYKPMVQADKEPSADKPVDDLPW